MDNDGGVYPIDVLWVINELNEPQYRDPVTGLLPPPPDPVPYYFDVDGDNFATAIDALQIINFLNADGGPRRAAGGDPGGRHGGRSRTFQLARVRTGSCVGKDRLQCHGGPRRVGRHGASQSTDATSGSRLVPELQAGERAVMFDTPSGTDAGVVAPDSAAGLEEDLLLTLAQDVAAVD